MRGARGEKGRFSSYHLSVPPFEKKKGLVKYEQVIFSCLASTNNGVASATDKRRNKEKILLFFFSRICGELQQEITDVRTSFFFLSLVALLPRTAIY